MRALRIIWKRTRICLRMRFAYLCFARRFVWMLTCVGPGLATNQDVDFSAVYLMLASPFAARGLGKSLAASAFGPVLCRAFTILGVSPHSAGDAAHCRFPQMN